MIGSGVTIPVLNRGLVAKFCGGIQLPPGVWVTVPLSFLGQFGWDRDLLFDYQEFHSQMQTRDELGRFMFDWWCPLSGQDGYGRHALSIFKGFQLLGAQPWLHNDGWGVDREFLPSEIEAAKYAGSSRIPSKIAGMMTLPYHVYETQSLINVIVTQFETDHIPEKHIANVNKTDHLIVTSSFQPKIWKNSGCKVPISVMTPGVDTDLYEYRERPKDGRFKVLMVGALTGRKNPEGAIRIFQAASEGNQDWRLTIKTRKTNNLRRLAGVAANDSRITLIVEDWHPQQILKLYYSHDAFLWPSKGEGVGLPPLEAMATGMEVVSCNHSGMGDFIHDSVAWPIKTAGMEPANIPNQGFSPTYTYQFGSVGNWWLPDEQHGVEQLKRCFEAWYAGRGKGLKAANYVRERHTLKHQAASVLKVLMQYE
jgi:glycosyltransferase involved in cell wall biosynthesis